ncbi:amidohydrolase family protein [Microbacterium sp. GXS0129]|uniref:amidohydrolase family protein n=1 Tax=Microbacterium sp. GXS0129 TaxID=3377836 RepID=UPI00383A017C
MLIGLEEHYVDAAVSRGASSRFAVEGGFLANIVSEPPRRLTRPQIESTERANDLVYDTGEGRIAAMDAEGIDVQILSLSNSAATQYIGGDEIVAITRQANDDLATSVAEHPDRFRAFAGLPWTDVDETVAELHRTVEEHGFVGAMICGTVGGQFLDQPQFESVLAAFARVKKPLFLHPNVPNPAVRAAYFENLRNNEVSALLASYAWGWHNEAAIHLIRIMLSGALDRHADLRLITGHWGETVPYSLQRLDDALPPSVTGLDRTLTQTFRDQIYVSPSGQLGDEYRPHFNFVRELIGIDRMLYSSDYPYLNLTGTKDYFASLGLSQEDRDKFTHINAQRLLGI